MHQPHHLSPPASPFCKIFVPGRLFAGIGFVLLGALLLAAMLFLVPHIGIRTLLFGPFFILLGFAAMWSSRAQGCVGCKVPLEDTSTAFPSELTRHVQHAVGWSGHGNVEALLQLQHAPLAVTPRMSSVLIDFCPACNNVAQLATATSVRLPDGTSAEENISPRVTLLGPGVRRVIDMVEHRNTAMTHAMYAPR